jgi:hypothetical protein
MTLFDDPSHEKGLLLGAGGTFIGDVQLYNRRR